eukprot:3591775-Lingulodinium_polyedra.AAC.1
MRNLSRTYPTEECRAADFKPWAAGAKLYCESTEFMLPRIGQPYLSASFGASPSCRPRTSVPSSPCVRSSSTSTA